jgi:hypothetical protein
MMFVVFEERRTSERFPDTGGIAAFSLSTL